MYSEKRRLLPKVRRLRAIFIAIAKCCSPLAQAAHSPRRACPHSLLYTALFPRDPSYFTDQLSALVSTWLPPQITPQNKSVSHSFFILLNYLHASHDLSLPFLYFFHLFHLFTPLIRVWKCLRTESAIVLAEPTTSHPTNVSSSFNHRNNHNLFKIVVLLPRSAAVPIWEPNLCNNPSGDLLDAYHRKLNNNDDSDNNAPGQGENCEITEMPLPLSLCATTRSAFSHRRKCASL